MSRRTARDIGLITAGFALLALISVAPAIAIYVGIVAAVYFGLFR